MTTIEVYQYLASWDDEESLDDLIALWTKLFNWNTPPHSHSEIKLRPIGRQPTMFSSTLRGGAKGTRFADPKDVLKYSERWDCYRKKFTAFEAEEMYKRAVRIAHLKYFKIGLVLDFLTPVGILGAWLGKKLKQWYCSMAVYYVITGKRRRISPRKLTKWMLKNGWVNE